MFMRQLKPLAAAAAILLAATTAEARDPSQGELFMGGDYVLEVFNRGSYEAHFTMYKGIY